MGMLSSCNGQKNYTVQRISTLSLLKPIYLFLHQICCF